ncbi:MAG: acyltransferase [Proteobacteria bacterium]|nr:acyltransferase [Pseudomonadota bacterium]
MKSSNFGYIPALDHLRGFAALLVLFFHGGHLIAHKLQSDVPYALSFWPRADNPFSSLILEGHTAVSLFFVLSAFVFTVGSANRELNFTGFYRNRLLRTYPLFLFFLGVGILFNPENFSWPGFARSIFFGANSPDAIDGGAFTFVFWTIAVEWHFYLLFPLLILLVKKFDWHLLPALILLFLTIRCYMMLQGADMLVVSYWTIVGRIDQFLIGMIAGLYYLQHFEQGRKFDGVALVGLILVLTALFVFNQYGGNGSNNQKWAFWPTIEASCWAVFVLGYLSIARHFPAWLGKGLVALGTVSYSIYLVHYVVLDFLMSRDWDVFIRIADPFGTAMLNTTLILMPLVVLVSTGTYWLIERPFLVRRKTYMRQSEAIEPA